MNSEKRYLERSNCALAGWDVLASSRDLTHCCKPYFPTKDPHTAPDEWRIFFLMTPSLVSWHYTGNGTDFVCSSPQPNEADIPKNCETISVFSRISTRMRISFISSVRSSFSVE